MGLKMSSMPKRSGLVGLASEGVLLAGLTAGFFIDLFLPWGPSPVCLAPGPVIRSPFTTHAAILQPFGFCGGVQTGLGGAGLAAALFALALLLWEALRLARISLMLSSAYRSLISTFLSAALLMFTILDLIPHFGSLVSNPGDVPFGGAFAWVGLALALLIAGLGLVHWRIWQTGAPPALDHPRSGASTRPSGVASPDSQICPSCGRVLLAGAHFCSHCGQAAPGWTLRPTPSDPRSEL